MYFHILNHAKKYVHIMTPYLILDSDMITSLTFAAKRGIETIIIMPHIPDKIYAYLLARSYYAELLQAGVKIYEYMPGFVHAKVFTSDDTKAVVGSINLDFRSLYHHFENGVLLHGCGALGAIGEDFEQIFEVSREVTEQYKGKRSMGLRIIQCILRLFAPLL